MSSGKAGRGGRLLRRLFGRPEFVVYTVLTGAYERLGNPFPPGATGFERICFTDDPSLSSPDWSVVLMSSSELDPARESRRPKLLAHRVLPDFESSLYIDNTMRLKVDPQEIRHRFATRDAPFVSFRHPWRDCVYEEGEAVIQHGIDSEVRVREQLDYYRSRAYPSRSGLIAGGMLLRRHLDESVIRISEEWFEHVLRFSKRDQLSFNYVAWRQGFRHVHFTGELTDNPWVDWAASSGERLPYDFCDATYLWLNPEVAGSGLTPRRHYLQEGSARSLRFSLHRWELDRLANKYRSDKGSLYYNAHAYAAVYETYFRDRQLDDIHLLELGLLRHDVQARNPGGPYDDLPSLKMWREYFPNARIVGFDIADFSAAPAMPGVSIVRGDMGEPDDLQRLVKESVAPFDIIIDDGSHASHHQQIAFAELFPYVKPGGYYCIEDLCYQPPQWEKATAIKTQKILWSLSAGETPSSPCIQPHQARYLRDNIDRVDFHDSHDRLFGGLAQDSLAVIRKKT